ncbi:hypothetical protein [Mongoliitalea daihaiensis]|uniref:hypothetical protein n=1 Tax=Mongoliitalea daihaiensis TaxID=2782006 RepID=UPI001F40EFDF|nr:hypothetical protein [Mongoliitalea daihaiensis]UJP66150.1 hypothetical protein IPZ59_05870 [Mongoliitalea daihaiensis]
MLAQIQHMKALSIAMLGLWCLIFWNNFNNKHVHLTENGHLIVHAHPLQNGETDHDHTEEEYIFWDIISNAHFHSVATEVVIPDNIATSFIELKGISIESFFDCIDKTPSSLRGPPIFIS